MEEKSASVTCVYISLPNYSLSGKTEKQIGSGITATNGRRAVGVIKFETTYNSRQQRHVLTVQCLKKKTNKQEEKEHKFLYGSDSQVRKAVMSKCCY